MDAKKYLKSQIHTSPIFLKTQNIFDNLVSKGLISELDKYACSYNMLTDVIRTPKGDFKGEDYV
jgi:hypothetical protein